MSLSMTLFASSPSIVKLVEVETFALRMGDFAWVILSAGCCQWQRRSVVTPRTTVYATSNNATSNGCAWPQADVK